MPTNVPITQDTTNPFSESDISINPVDLRLMIAGSNSNAASTQAQYWSNDGGATWNQSNLPLNAGDSFQSDPAVGWTSDGNAWALTIAIQLSGNLIVRSFKSVDGGKTWTFDSVVSGTQTFTDKPLLWVDRVPSSPFRDNMYAVWHLNAQCFVSVRAGTAGTWQTPIQVSGAETSFTADGGDVKTNSFGDVFAFWPDAGGQTLRVAKSTNGGASFNALAGGPIEIASTSGSFTIKIPAQDARLASGGGTIGTLIYVTGGAFRTATEDLVFACWHDLDGGPGCNAEADQPIGNVASPCKTRIFFARSTDGGATWGPKQKLNDQPFLNDQFFPRLVVDDTTGILAVVYYDTIKDPNRVKTDIWMQTSKDGGVTWSHAERITTAETDEATGAEDNQQEYGDYIGLTCYAGRYFACWTDRRSNSFEQIWGAGFKLAFLVTSIANSGHFGNVCVGAFADELLTINNSGPNPLYITGIASSSVDFLPPSVVSYPMVLGPGSSVDVVIRFEPKSAGVKNATITIFSSDPTGPHKIKVSGDGHTARLSLVIADKGFFGRVCVRSFVDKPLVIDNSSRCALLVTDITSSLGDFIVPDVLSYPLAIGGGDSLTVPIRFEPTVAGLRSATLSVISSDPASPHQIKVSGDGELSRLTLMIADKGHFGKVCVGSHRDEPLILNNSSSCALSVSAITSSSAEVEAPEVLPYPLVIAAGNFLPVPIRFRPSSFGQKSADITVVSTDPASPHVIKVEGYAPTGRLAITGSAIFGGVNACCCADRTISICNVGECALHVTSVHFKRKSRHWKLLHNPFPATLRSGSCLAVVIQYRATERCPRCCELVIESDDPVTPVKVLDVLAYTVWDSCCKDHCDDCHEGGCDKQHKESCCQQGYPCCSEDDEQEEEQRPKS